MAFLSDLHAAETATQSALTQGYIARTSKAWGKWVDFCRSLNTNPQLCDAANPIMLLQIFASRVRDGRSSESG